MPNRPITAIRNSKPRSSSVEPKVMRSWPVTVSRPTAASAKPSIIAASVLNGEPAAHADEAAEGQELDREELGRPELQRERATSGARKVITMHGDEARRRTTR